MEEALLERLRATAAITGLLTTKNSRPAIDWIERSESLPCISLQDVATGRRYAQDGAVNLENPMVQIDCWANSYGEAKVIARAVIVEMEAAETVSGIEFDESFLVSEREMNPEDLGSGIKVFRVSLDFSVWFTPV